MGRLARVVVPGHPHHVTQRGNAALTFFDDPDYALYRDLLAANCRAAEGEPDVPSNQAGVGRPD